MKRLTKLVTEKELASLAKAVSADVSPKVNRALLVFLSGNLGSGKTTFTQKAAKYLGVTEKILSPTFVFVHEHKIPEAFSIKHETEKKFKRLIHVDAYRIETKRDLEAIGLREYIKNPEYLILIEWAEKIARWLPKPDIVLHFKHHSPKLRNVKIKYQK